MKHDPGWYCPCMPIPVTVLRLCRHPNTFYIHRVDDEIPEYQAEYLAGFMEGLDAARHSRCPTC